MVGKRASRASSAAMHAGRPDSVRKRGRIISVSTESDEATPREERYGGGGTYGVYENSFAHTAALADSVTCIVEVWLCCEDVLHYHVTAKKKRRTSYERVHVCLYVRVTFTLQHVSLLTLEGTIMPFFVVPTAAETASATLAQCPDWAREISQIRQL